MNAALLAKIFGWAQFVLPVIAQVSSSGSPHGFAGWAATLGSLFAAVGVHAAASTDGKQ